MRIISGPSLRFLFLAHYIYTYILDLSIYLPTYLTIGPAFDVIITTDLLEQSRTNSNRSIHTYIHTYINTYKQVDEIDQWS